MNSTPLRPLDIVVIVAYLIGMAAMGLFFARRNTSTLVSRRWQRRGSLRADCAISLSQIQFSIGRR